MNYKKTILMLLSLSVVSLAYAHTGATGVVKERMDAMQDMGDKSKLVADMFKGKAEFDRAAIEDAADVFSQHGATMDDLFPDTKHSRTGSKTEALPIIWSERDEFTEQIDIFVALTDELKLTLADTDNVKALRKAFFQTTKGCSGCHKIYRKPKN